MPLPDLSHLNVVATAKDWTSGDHARVWLDYKHLIEAAIDNQPRSLQKSIGPSELGTPCDRCLISKLAHLPEIRQPGTSWLPFVGTAVHAQLEEIFSHANADMPHARYLVESTVSVGEVGGEDITGHADLFDLHSGAVTDWKIVGATTLKKARAHGPSETYRRQAHLYGRGFTRRGLRVTAVRIAFLPRNDVTLSGAFIWSEPFDPALAELTLLRANAFAYGISTLGVEATMAVAPPHGQEFSCQRFGAPSIRTGHTTTASLFT